VTSRRRRRSRSIPSETLAEAVQTILNGSSIYGAAKRFGISRGTLWKAVDRAKKSAGTTTNVAAGTAPSASPPTIPPGALGIRTFEPEPPSPVELPVPPFGATDPDLAHRRWVRANLADIPDDLFDDLTADEPPSTAAPPSPLPDADRDRDPGSPLSGALPRWLAPPGPGRHPLSVSSMEDGLRPGRQDPPATVPVISDREAR
jgi:hypothetical protein